jgi:hypothetical protein
MGPRRDGGPMATAPARIAGVYDACVLPAPGIPLLAPTRCSPRTAAVLGQCLGGDLQRPVVPGPLRHSRFGVIARAAAFQPGLLAVRTSAGSSGTRVAHATSSMGPVRGERRSEDTPPHAGCSLEHPFPRAEGGTHRSPKAASPGTNLVPSRASAACHAEAARRRHTEKKEERSDRRPKATVSACKPCCLTQPDMTPRPCSRLPVAGADGRVDEHRRDLPMRVVPELRP